ncbi:HNH endonuclease [Polaribacter sp. R2A056_3_33]|uniref:HNH endonuclease n=1 Tax=Polaribacter sp. R2A056_3_33 TaxID=2745563 RepID=UPI001C4EEC4D|nr:HNH endonuclease [Polaribacter sp. R2A056_3_33]QXP70749.1 HNH endonuclease [Polaribacter sp. R2A056_3_33]
MKEIKTEFEATLNYGIEAKIGLKGLIIESRGGTKNSNNYRNPEHSLLLTDVLKKMHNAKVADLEIYVASNSSNYANIDERKISFNGKDIIDLTKVQDFGALLKDIKKGIKQSGQKKSTTGGNSTKRLLVYSDNFDLEKLFENPLDVLSDTEFNEEDPEFTLQKIKKRLGQSKFRKELLEAYNNTCAVTGSRVLEILEAAHIEPYNGAHTSVVNNGILLRSDIHDLFDLYKDEKRLIGISSDFKIEVHPSLKDSEYWKYDGKGISLPKDKSDYPKFD